MAMLKDSFATAEEVRAHIRKWRVKVIVAAILGAGVGLWFGIDIGIRLAGG